MLDKFTSFSYKNNSYFHDVSKINHKKFGNSSSRRVYDVRGTVVVNLEELRIHNENHKLAYHQHGQSIKVC